MDYRNEYKKLAVEIMNWIEFIAKSIKIALSYSEFSLKLAHVQVKWD